MRYAILLLIAAAVGLTVWGFSYVRIPAKADWSRARFRRATLIAFGCALWPLLLLVFPITASLLPWILLAMVLGGTIGFLAGTGMRIALRENSTLVRVRSTSPIMELTVIMAVADALSRGFFPANSWLEASISLGGLAFSSTALLGVYAALNRRLRYPNADVDSVGDFSVVVRGFGANRVRVARTLIRAADVSFGEVFPGAHFPKTVLEDADEARATSLRDQLEAAGATVELVRGSPA